MPREVEVALRDTAEDVVRIQQEQLFEGTKADDDVIFNKKTGSEYYSPSYAKYKGKDSPIDLKDRGAFYDGIKATSESEGLLIDSTDEKAEMLKETYGEEIFGLGTDSKKEYIPIAHKRLLRNVEVQINER